MNPEPHLRVGLWLGTANRIVEMRWFRYGWRMTDSTGNHYRQPEYPHGLAATPEIEPDTTKRPRVPWPDPLP